ncbi:MAG: membrane-bound lytic murein transglycosylase MltF [Pseudomonadota bacterium]
MRLVLALIAGALLTTPHFPPPILEQVLETGRLRVVTRNAPTAWYIGSDGPTGPEYDLVRGFSEDLGVELDMVPMDSFSELVPSVAQGDAHMAAGALSITEPRLALVRFSQPYQQVEQHLIYRRGTGRPQSLVEVQNREIVVVAGSSHADTMRALEPDLPLLRWREDASVDAADLLEQVAEGDIDYTVADSTDFSIHRNFHPELRIALELEVADSIAWAFPPDGDDTLIVRANQYLQKIRRNGELTRILDRYYGHNDEFDYVGTRSFIRHYESRLPRYRELFLEAASANELDWQLLAAMGYQESHWRRGAVSPTGVRGIMMLTQATADYLGIEDRTDPASSISGGARFYARLKARLNDSIPEPDRTWMALAAYNVGFYHVEDARKIVEMQDGDPNRWVDVRDALPLLARKKWYSRVPYGYARGWEPVEYVENIRNYRDILHWLENRDNDSEPDETAPETPPEATSEGTETRA